MLSNILNKPTEELPENLREFKEYNEWCKKNNLKPCYATSLQQFMEKKHVK